MTAYTFSTGIPAAANNPSADQPLMLQNNVSAEAILGTDHVTYNDTGPVGAPQGISGQHLKITFNGKNVPLGSPTDALSYLYTNSGDASSVSQLFFRNQNATFPISPIAAFGAYPGALANGAVVALNQYNVTSVTRIAAGNYSVVLNMNVVTGTSFGVLASATLNSLTAALIIFPNYTITGAGQFSLRFFTLGPSAVDPQQFTFQVLQI